MSRALAGALALAALIVPQVAMPQDELEVPRPVDAVFFHMNGTRLDEPLAIFLDATANEVFVADYGNDTIGIFDADGMPKFAFQPHGVSRPAAVMADSRGRIYVLGSGTPAVQVYTYRGEPLGTFPFHNDGGPIDVMPTAMTAAADGRLIFADHRSHRILVFDLDWKFAMAFGHEGQDRGAFSAVAGLAVGPQGQIAVADRAGIPIQVFSPAGRLVAAWGDHDIGDLNFSTPAGLAMDAAGRVWIADALRQDVKVFDADGSFLFHFGGYGTEPGQVRYPVDVALGPDGRVFVCEKVGRRVQIFEPPGVATERHRPH